jgi:signal transduction histidine kinase
MLARLLKRAFARTGRDSDVWPVALLLSAVLVPAACLLWFMSAAMRNERLAAQQKLADAYRAQLSASQQRLQRHWMETATVLENTLATNPAPAAFAQCVQSGLVDGVVLFDQEGHILYPNKPSAENDAPEDRSQLEPKWQEASRLEYQRNYLEAAKRYDALGLETTNHSLAARAFQAEARCRAQAGQNDAVIQLVTDLFGHERFRHAADPQGRLIAANAELMALEFVTNRNSPAFQSIARRLAARLADYGNTALASPQRRFLMKEVQGLSPEQIPFPTLAAEELAAEVSEHTARPSGDPTWQRSVAPGTWQWITPNRRVLALLRSEKLLAAAKAAMAPESAPADVAITLVAPDVEAVDAFATLPAGEHMPGWRLALFLKDRTFFDAAAGRQSALYLWTGIAVVGAMGVLAVIAVRAVRRQMTLARLKNDLAATVSHELKTPLSSMRVLVDTLLGSEKFDEQRTREYLQLIAQENERLGRLIQNFLTFSRMERKKYTFHFSPLPVRPIVDAAVEPMRGRFAAPGCRLEVEVEENLPSILADPDALVAALTNLLENAHKYSEEAKHVVLQARAVNGSVTFSVKDNGVGITSRELKSIFQPFYQVDQRLSRKGSGCGLGLSIVQFIVAAHRGTVAVESQPGNGSTFTLSLPVASTKTASIGKEAIA